MAAAVGICLAAACEQGVVQEAALSAAGLRVRRVTSGAADLIVCKGGSTLAFMLWSEGSDCAARVPRLAAAARHAIVLVPHELMESPAAVGAASRCDDSTLWVCMPLGAEFTQRSLQLADALLHAEPADWRQQQEEVMASSHSVSHVLLGLPALGGGEGGGEDAAHQGNLLCMLGSLQHISQRSGEDIAALTGIEPGTAASVAAFFRRGERPAAGLQGLSPSGAPLPAL